MARRTWRLLAALAPPAAAAPEYHILCSGTVDEAQGCQLQSCTPGAAPCDPVDAAWAPWDPWGDCSCHAELRQRSRVVLTHARCGGAPIAGAEVEAEPCDAPSSCDDFYAVVPCLVSDWSMWSECDCGISQVYRTRIADDGANCGKTCNDALEETRPCDADILPHCARISDCKYTEWGQWSECPVTCGGAQRSRTRAVAMPARRGGDPCAAGLAETRECGSQCCPGTPEPVDCAWGAWGDWSACSTDCGGGTMHRTRTVAQFPRHGGKPCKAVATEEYARCNFMPCRGATAVNAAWGSWTEWSECSATCGSAFKARQRDVAVKQQAHGAPVRGPFQEFVPCHLFSCEVHKPVDCRFQDWSPWTDCSCKCNGHRRQARDVASHGAYGGALCAGALARLEACNVPGTPAGAACPVEELPPCAFSDWSPFSNCSAKCGGGMRTRYRSIADPETSDACTGPLSEAVACNLVPCFELGKEVDCAWDDWEDWETCSATCGGGQRLSHRRVLRHAQYGGRPCEGHSSTRIGACAAQPCEKLRYCEWTAWSAWGACSKSCGGGDRVRTKKLHFVVPNSTEQAPGPADYLDTSSLAQQVALNRLELRQRRQVLGRQVAWAAYAAGGVVGILVLARSTRFRGPPLLEG